MWRNYCRKIKCFFLWFWYRNRKKSYTKCSFLGIERSILTCEDFYDPKYIKNSSDKFGNKYGFSVKINEEKLNDNSISNISVIEEWIRYNENDNKRAKELIKEIKVHLAENVKKDNITDDYIILLDKLIDFLKI